VIRRPAKGSVAHMATQPFDDVCLILHSADNVAVLKRAVRAGAELANRFLSITADRGIPAGHKIAIAPIAEGAPIRKYGQTIGFAREVISPGEHVHTHNVAVHDFDRDCQIGVDATPIDYVPPERGRTFQGFVRPGGKVGTRNYVSVISSVNCSASVSKYVADRFKTPEFRRQYPNVDGVVAFAHKVGCGIPPGEPHRILQRVAAGLARHPNIFGYVMIGLGCEVNQVQFIRADHQLDVVPAGAPRPTFMNIQSTGGVTKTVNAAAEAVARLLPHANEARRTTQPVSHLILATNCGGSDGNSGITANPALGVAADELIRHGGTAVLAETPEIYGAEHLLVRRAVSREVGEKLIERIRWWERYARANDATIDNNPSWGNKEGGLTTIYEKSLGAVSKGGLSPLAAVYHYAEPITEHGLCFMDTPGYDPVSMTGLVCGGCTIGVFTTGRGSVYGCKPSPCIKLTTNTDVYSRLIDDMDLNAGTILDGTETLQQVGMRLFDKIIEVASGEKTKSELAGIGDEEFAPWLLGAQF
jgi:altronate hydrolase